VEKKPLYHFAPGAPVLSFGTAGCNLGCRFCQNWGISMAREMDSLTDRAGPDEIAEAAFAMGCRAVAYTYNDPIVFAEYAIDTAAACASRGLANIAVTAGYIDGPARADLFGAMDAANIDLKSFSDSFYRRLTGGRLGPVLETIEYVVRETSVWVELTTLVIPGHNDSTAELEALTAWVAGTLGPDIPLHFSAFHPDSRLRDVPPTPLSSLVRARAIAREAGLRYVYLGNVHADDAGTTVCPACSASVVVRSGYAVTDYAVTPSGECARCGARIPGRWAGAPGSFGSRRLPVRFNL
jgi:pyruvate formate lyase activating enzyme